MYPHVCHVFIDGAYLRVEAEKLRNTGDVHPLNLASNMVGQPTVQGWASDHTTGRRNALMGRVTYYDALPNDDEESERQEYWDAIELLPDVHLGFGALKALKRKRRQKGVDTLIAVDMLVGAFSELFDIAILLAGDADFIPVVEEVRRRGVMVVVAGVESSVSEDLRRVADRYVEIDVGWLDPMEIS